LRQQSSKCFETAVQAAVSKANLDASDAFRGALADARAECFKQVEESRAREESTRRSALEEIQASRAREDLEHKALYDAAVEKAALAESVRRLEESQLREEAIRQSRMQTNAPLTLFSTHTGKRSLLLLPFKTAARSFHKNQMQAKVQRRKSSARC